MERTKPAPFIPFALFEDGRRAAGERIRPNMTDQQSRTKVALAKLPLHSPRRTLRAVHTLSWRTAESRRHRPPSARHNRRNRARQSANFASGACLCVIFGENAGRWQAHAETAFRCFHGFRQVSEAVLTAERWDGIFSPQSSTVRVIIGTGACETRRAL